MTNRERFLNTLNFKPVDRLPVVEWAGWWDKTIIRWKNEGLPKNLTGELEIRDYFGLDRMCQCWIEPREKNFTENHENYKALITNFDDYNKLKERLFPKEAFDKKMIEGWKELHKKNDLVVWITIEGFFWFPRTLFGMEEQNFAFYDSPELMHQINKDLLEFNLRVLDEFCAILKPDFMTFAEDMSYNKGPMISKNLFNEFMVPYYKQIIPRIKEYGTIPLIDTDGNPTELIPWFIEIGAEGMLPMERQAGTDIVQYRKDFPTFKIVGGFDKTVMSKGKQAMREEFERLLPLMKSGGYVPGVDHQTPPEVSMEEYKIYLELLREYAGKI